VDYDSNEPLRPGFNPYHGISAICWAARQVKPDCILIGEFWHLEGTHPAKDREAAGARNADGRSLERRVSPHASRKC
jgi:hypothetical protein